MNHGKLHLLTSELSTMLVLGKVQNNSSNFHYKWVSLSCKLFCMLSGSRAAASLSDFKCMCIYVGKATCILSATLGFC